MIEDEIARSCALIQGDGASAPGCGPESTSKEAAAEVVKRYYSAIDARDFDTAWQQWGDDGPPRQTRETFRAGFARTQSTRVTIGAVTDGEGAAGSIFLTVPVTVDAVVDSGRHQKFRGHYILRRVNGVDGASASQLRWHIESAALKAVAAG
ncbi:hypothetical protein FHR22_002775 [Sphingopyxis panaciterrae]|uniref:hypothetical protein n=1 Tax=Sphingopyxis panaciterrae TaxID=363841 RepID=UPI001FBB6B0E|nr:hypothetical protein [Sphingopyxis panaciterrae]NIJ38072.1 hypothetical protein [Sphingopyxis panaciterrae]